MTPICPICGSETFAPHGKAGHPRCTTCASLPRNRSALLLLMHNCTLRKGLKIAHFAP